MSPEIILALIKPLLVLGLLLTNTIILIWLERKVVAGMQSRVGPDRAGPFGILQTLADAIKLLLKEQICMLCFLQEFLKNSFLLFVSLCA